MTVRLTMDITDELYQALIDEAGIDVSQYDGLKLKNRYIAEAIKMHLYERLGIARPLKATEKMKLRRVNAQIEKLAEREKAIIEGIHKDEQSGDDE